MIQNLFKFCRKERKIRKPILFRKEYTHAYVDSIVCSQPSLCTNYCFDFPTEIFLLYRLLIRTSTEPFTPLKTRKILINLRK